MKTPIRNGVLQSDLDANGHQVGSLNQSNYAGVGLTWNTTTSRFDVDSDTTALIRANVKDPPYNATGDGVTDDTVAIQSAINAVAAAGGGTVFFPAGTYLCNGAFDATTNSILKIPFRDQTQTPIGIMLLGESPGIYPTPWFTSVAGSRIRSTKVGTGTAPAILAAGVYMPPQDPTQPHPAITLFNHTDVFIKNMQFRATANPTLFGVRLDSAVNSDVDNVIIDTDTTGGAQIPTEPTHATVALTLSASNSSGFNRAHHVASWNYDTAFRIGENTILINCQAGWSKTAVEFTDAYSGSRCVGFQIAQCAVSFRWTGEHGVFIEGTTERNPGVDPVWTTQTADVYDPNNWGSGLIMFKLSALGTENPTWPMLMTGGTQIISVNLRTGEIALSSACKITGKGSVPPGGTTGQSLKKLSNTDYDVGWA